MIIQRCINTLAGLILLVSEVCSQSAVSFLLISPSAEMNGRGEVSVAMPAADPLSTVTNPAHLGMFGLGNNFSSGWNHAAWLPGFQQDDLTYTSYAFNGGVNLQTAFGFGAEIGIGLSYSRVYLDLGEFAETRDDPTVIRMFHAYESSHQYGIGVGINSWVRASAGITFKRVFSALNPVDIQGMGDAGTANVSTFDYGLLLDAPVVDIVSRLSGSPVNLARNWRPFFDIGFGFANNNLGNRSVTYSVNSGADPLPRYARAGISIRTGLEYTINDVPLRPVTFTWSVESNDLLITRNPPPRDSLGFPLGNGSWQYLSGLGGIKVLDELILGHSNRETILKRGWEISFADFIVMRWGRFEEDPRFGGRNFTTTGIGIHAKGLFSFLRAVNPDLSSNPVVGFVLSHVDIRYDGSNLVTKDRSHPLNGTTFRCGSVVISN